jgi:DNA-binding transcriptional ArsR family regulator
MSWWADGRSESPGVLLSADCRSFRRAVRPVVWVVLEEIALDAELDNGRLVARTSARQVAEQLGLNPTTAAEALRVLGRRGLISLEREKGPGGRFGLSVYQLRAPAGLMVVQPCVAEPYVVSPSMERADVAGAVAVSSCATPSHMESPKVERSAMDLLDAPAVGPNPLPTSDPDGAAAKAGDGSPRRRSRSMASPGSSRHCPGQTALDLGMGSS